LIFPRNVVQYLHHHLILIEKLHNTKIFAFVAPNIVTITTKYLTESWFFTEMLFNIPNTTWFLLKNLTSPKFMLLLHQILSPSPQNT